MVFDPVSVVGYVGTAAGFVSFLASTISVLEKRVRDYRDCGKQLRWYRTRLESCRLFLNAWPMLWCHGQQTYTDEEYEYFWGAEGFLEMKEKIELIELEIGDIGMLLHAGGREPAANGGPPQWIGWRQDWERIRTSPGNLDVAMVRKLCFASFRGANLDERVKRLKEKVDDLREFSSISFSVAQGRTDVTSAVTTNDLRMLLTRKIWLDDLTQPLKELYAECNMLGDTWSLVMSAPDEEGRLTSIEDETDVVIEFDVFHTDQFEPKTTPVGILPVRCSLLRERSCEISEAIANVRKLEASTIPTSWSQSLNDLLYGDGTEFSQTMKAHDVHSKVVRTSTAVGLVNWMVLLWDTPWTLGLCSCRIRFAFLDARKKQYNATFTSMRNTFVRPFCLEETLEVRKSLLLGVSLAELALGTPITVTIGDDGRLVFHVNGSPCSKTELLLVVQAQSGKQFRSSIDYCLYHDERWHRDSRFRPSDVVQFKEQVLDP
jgi:hypothetical protein